MACLSCCQAWRASSTEPLSSVVAVVIDKSPSQNFGDRTKQTEEARAVLAERLGRIPGLEVRFVEAGEADQGGQGQDGEGFVMVWHGLGCGLSKVLSEASNRMSGKVLEKRLLRLSFPGRRITRKIGD